MDEDSILQIGGLVVSLIFTGCFAAIEALLERLSKDEILEAIEQGGRNADRVTDWLKRPWRYTLTIIVAKNVALVTAIALLVHQMQPPAQGRILIWAGAILMTILVAEVIPRNYIRGSRGASLVVGLGIVQVTSWILAPIIYPLNWLGRLGTRILGRPLVIEESIVSPEDIEALEKLGDSEEFFEQEERDMIDRILEWPDTIAREIMVPRTDMVCLEINASMEEILQTAIESRHSRIPVYEGVIDNIVGILHVKDMLEWWQRDEPINLRELIKQRNRHPFFAPENKKINELFQELRRHKQHLAILVDEYGGTAGMVTLEDIIEEIVGDIRDEYDTEEEWIIQEGENSYRVDARVDLQEFSERLGTSLESENVDTIGGFIVELVGRVPSPEDSPIEYRNLRFTILESDERRILKMRVVKRSPGSASAETE